MIAQLRRRHRQMAIAMALVIPSILTAALLARRPPAIEAVPFATRPTLGRTVIAAQGVVSGVLVSASVDPTGVLLISATTSLRQPDLLLYWTGSTMAASDSLPADAVLLGPVSGERSEAFRLPTARNNRPGQLLFYSLGHAQTIGSVALPAGSAP